MTQEPFKVRLTGSSAGTLDQVIVQIELVDRAKAAVITPWAWYRGDDLTGTEILEWTDRSGGAGTLDAISTDGGTGTLKPSAIDSKPGVEGWAQYQATFTAQTWQQATMVQVWVSDPSATNWGAIGGPTLFDLLNVWHDFEEIEIQGTWTGGESAGAMVDFSNTDPHYFVAVRSAGGLDLWLDGAKIATYTGSLTAGGATDLFLAPTFGVTVAELIVFDRDLDPASDLIDFGDAGTATINGYLASRYPSLF